MVGAVALLAHPLVQAADAYRPSILAGMEVFCAPEQRHNSKVLRSHGLDRQLRIP